MSSHAIPNESTGKSVEKKPGIGFRHLQVFLMCLCVTSFYIVRSSMSIAVLAMTDSGPGDEKKINTFSWDKKIQGAVLSSFFWGYMLMQIPSGVLAKKYGAKPILLVALLINTALCLLGPVILYLGGWRALCASRAGIGLSQGCLFPAIHTLLGKWIPEQERAWLSNVVYAGVQLGTIISLPVCGLLARTCFGWKSIFYAVGALGLATSVIWWYFAASSPANYLMISERERAYIEGSLNSSRYEKRTKKIPWAGFAKSVPLYALICTHIGVNWTFVTFFVEIPSYVACVLKIRLHQNCWISALPFFAMWINSLLSGYLCEYITNAKIMSLTTSRKFFNSIASFGVALGLIILSFISSDHKILAITVLTATVALQSSSFSGFLLNHIDLSPEYAGVILGISNTLSNTIGVLAPITTGLILGNENLDPGRWRIVFVMAAVIISSTNVVFLIYGTSEKQNFDEVSGDRNDDTELLLLLSNK